MKVLVVYYSRTGHTKGLAERIADQCGADIERIKDARPRSGAWAAISSGREALFKRAAAIKQAQTDPSAYDLVILGTPVWAWTLSSPMRAYLTQNGSSLGRVAFFCTEGGSGGDRAFQAMSDLIGKRPVATLEVTETDLKSGSDRDKLKLFVGTIAGLGNLGGPETPGEGETVRPPSST